MIAEDDVRKGVKKICQQSLKSVMISAFAVGMTACQQTTAPTIVQQPLKTPEPVSGITPSSFRLPEGTGCTGDVARYRAVMDNDLATGHVYKGVYARVITEIDQADSACRAGRDAEASGMIHTTKIKFGYKVD
jgi:hypothetical protein